MKRLLTVLLVLLWAAPTWAATYYVRTDGNNGNAGTANTAGGAWLTIDYAADNVSAGDTVRVQAGTYAAVVTPGVSGSDGSLITFVADGVVTTCAWTFTARSYVRMIGFTVDTDAGGCTKVNGAITISGDNTYLEFWGNTLTDALYDGIRVSTTTDTLSNSLIIGNVIHTLGIDNYSGIALRLRGHHNVVAHNEIYNIDPDAFTTYGTYNRYLNNYVHGLREDGAGHPDIFQVGSSDMGWSYNVYDATLQIGNGALGNEHATQFSHGQAANCVTCPDFVQNILRRNVWHNVSSYTVGINQTTVADIAFTRYYHNTTADARTTAANNTKYGIEWYGDNTHDGFIHNNIEYDSWGTVAVDNLSVYYVDGGLTVGYNLAFDPDGSRTFAAPWTTQTSPQSNSDPKFVSFAGDDFTIGADSGAIGNAGPLTVTSGTGTGTTFNVATGGGGFFVGSNAANVPQYGGVLVAGDTITVGTDVVTVASVSGDAITVTESFTWGDAEPVYFGTDTTPDIGAYPYKAGGYGLTITHTQVGNTVTVTPNDADLVRWVVCYEDGIPVTVDAASPFTCTVGTGVLAVRAFPRYASETLMTQATGTPGAPSALTIGTDLSLSWTHDRANVTHFECQVGAGTPVSLGLPTPTSTTYASTLAACGTLAAGQQTVAVRACNGASCASTSRVVVKL